MTSRIAAVETKVCRKCHVAKPLTEFYRDSWGRDDGYMFQCKACQKYAVTKNHCERTGRSFKLAPEEYADLIADPCFYCDGEIDMGVDRLDSSLGYTTDNVVPCCRRCNLMKMEMPVNEFIAHVKRVADLWERTT